MFLVLVGVNVAEFQLLDLFENLQLIWDETRNWSMLLSSLAFTIYELHGSILILTLRRSSANSSKSSRLTSTVGIS